MPAWINEFHYDNAGTDAGEFIEIAATAGTDLTGWTIVRYNGNAPAAAVTYGTSTLSGIVGNQSGNGFGFIVVNFPVDGLQNGTADGFALVNAQGQVVQFLSYEGVMTASNGPAAGMTSVDVGASEPGTATGTSVSLTGSGTNYSDFTWTTTSATNNGTNTGQSFGGVVAPSVSIGDASVTEGAAGDARTLTFTLTRAGGTGAFSVNYGTANGTATAGSDYTAASGTVTFAAGEMTKTVTVAVTGDSTIENDETLVVNLSGATNGATITDAQGQGTILNDDVPPAVTGTPWINEFHYDNSSTDVGEFIEIAGPAGMSLSGYSLVLYNGNGGVVYATIPLNGVIGDQQNGYGTLSFAGPGSGIQNGPSGADTNGDGFALVAPDGHVVEFLSYEGVITATAGPAAGMSSTDVGVSEPGTANGTSIARVGSGTEGGEFSWTLSNDDTPGALNGGETIATAGIRVRISDVSVAEGDAGTKTMTFTVNRAGLPDAFSVNYATADGTASAGSDYLAKAGTLTFAAGETSKTVTVTVNGDTNFEVTEGFTVNLSGATNGAQIVDSQGQGTIVNDDIAPVHIYEIQGAGHTSPFANQRVVTEGVVTAVSTSGSRGFWMQDPNGDGDDRTSDAVFVYTGAAPTVTVGQLVRVDGTVDEFTGADTNNLTITEISTPTVTVLGTGTITPTIIGAGGRHVPSEAIGDDTDTFDPNTQGMDFYESIEGMLVTVKNAQALDATYQNATWVVADSGAGATGMNDRGGITISANDLNPERIQVYTGSSVSTVQPTYVAGDHLGDVTGVVTYYGGQYELLPVSIGSTTSAGSVPRQTTTLDGNADHVTVGAYNVENLDPNDPQAKFDQLAADIVGNLRGPDILSLEEVQDSDGPGSGTNYSGAVTVQKLIDAIVAAGGPRYQFVEVIPTAPTGGEPNGHIHQVILYDPSRVDYVAGSARTLTDTDPTNGDAYANSRQPLVADFNFHGEQLTVVSIHNYSRGGSEELFGAHQPATNSGDQRRIDQTTPVKQFVENLVAQNPNAHVVVTGDFNGFQFETAQSQLESGGALTNLTTLLDPTDRFSYGFGGNGQQIDHLFVSDSLLTNAEFDIVHLNTGNAVRPTDHDPILSRLYVNTAPVGAVDSYAANEDTALIVNAQGGVLTNDTDVNSDVLTAVLQQGPQHGTLTLNANGSFTYTAAANYNGADSFTYVARDGSGTVSQVQTVILNVAAVNDAPTVTGPLAATATEGGATVSLNALQGAADVDAGSSLSVVGVPANLPAGVTYDAATQTFTLDPTAAAYNSLASGQTQVVTVSYGVSDGTATTAQTASWTITGVNDAPVVTAALTGAATEGGASVTLNALAGASDPEGTTITVVNVPANLPAGVTYDAAAHSFVLDPTNGAYNGLRAGQTQVVTVSYGLSDGAATTDQTASWTVTGANDAPTATADTGAVINNQSVTLDVLANDTDPDAGDGKTIVSVSDTALGGHVTVVDGKLVYAADADAFDLLLPGLKVTDSFSYTMKDASGATSTATVKVTVTGSAWGAPQVGGNGDSTLTGTASTEYLDGGNGNDKLLGNDGADTLNGGNGNDTLVGGQGIDVLVGDNGNDSLNGGTGSDVLTGDNGNDTLNGGDGSDLLTGGNGSDRFVFSGAFGKDVVVDFDNSDVIQLDRSQFANFSSVLSHAQQVGANVVITYDADDTITLLDTRLSSLNSGDFTFV